MNLKKIIFITLALLITSCTQTASPSPATDTPSLQLPDLVVSFINVSMVDINGRCLNGFQIQATIANQGVSTASNVNAIETSTGQTYLIDTLEAGQKFIISFPATSPTGIYVIKVDPENIISELNETNNSLSFLSPTPTPVLNCIQSTPTVIAVP